MADLFYVYKYLNKCKKDFFASSFFIIIETAFELIIPFLMKDIINIGVLNGNLKQILLSGLLIIICAVFSMITGHFYAVFNARLVTSFTYNLRKEVFNNIQQYTFTDLDKFNTSTLVTRLTNDITIIGNTLTSGMRPLFRSPILLIMGIGLSFVLAPKLAPIFIIAGITLGFILGLIIYKTSPKYKILQEKIDDVNRIVRENVSGIRTVKAYVREDFEIKKLDVVNKENMDITKNTFKISQLNVFSFQLTMYCVTVLILGIGSVLVHNNELLVGNLSALLSYVLQIINSLMMLSNVFLLINRSFQSSKRIKEVLDIKNDFYSNNLIKKIEFKKIEFKNVFFKYNKNSDYVLEDINLTINKNETIGIIGSTGAGKTTLISLLLKLYDLNSGDILIDDISIKNYDEKILRDNISIVLQNNILFTGTIYDNMLWGNKNAKIEDVNEALTKACINDFVNELKEGVYYNLGQKGVNVSGGERQRLCIARALLKKPKVLILDDSTSACDTKTEIKILDNIQKEKLTCIIIAQRISSIMNADKIIVLNDGKISDIGTHKQLLEKSSIYQELYSEQIGGVKCEEI